MNLHTTDFEIECVFDDDCGLLIGRLSITYCRPDSGTDAARDVLGDQVSHLVVGAHQAAGHRTFAQVATIVLPSVDGDRPLGRSRNEGVDATCVIAMTM